MHYNILQLTQGGTSLIQWCIMHSCQILFKREIDFRCKNVCINN